MYSVYSEFRHLPNSDVPLGIQHFDPVRKKRLRTRYKDIPSIAMLGRALLEQLFEHNDFYNFQST